MKYRPENIKIGQKLKIIRKMNGLTQIETGYLLNISQSRLQGVESGRLDIPPEWIYTLHRELKVNPLYILGFESNVYRPDLNLLTEDQFDPKRPTYSPYIENANDKIEKIEYEGSKVHDEKDPVKRLRLVVLQKREKEKQ